MSAIYLHDLTLDDLISTFIEIELIKPDSFLIIKETLTRMGIAASAGNVLYQSCHILQKRGKFYITHFKQLFALDGREVSMTKDDSIRLHLIAKTLEQWNLCKVLSTLSVPETFPKGFLTIVPHSKKSDYHLSSKYSIGSKKKKVADSERIK